jgi:Cu-processing system permease protein
MNTVATIVRYELRDLTRNRWVLAYLAVLLVLTDALLRLGGTGPRALLSLLNVVVALVPLVSIVFGTIYWHASREFNELLLVQPVRRRTLFAGLYLGLVLPLAGAVTLGLVVPMVLERAIDAETLPLLAAFVAVAIALTAVFSALALLIGVRIDDRLSGVGLALGVWFLVTLGYDGLVLLALSTFGDWPLETPLLGATLLNPVDLARVVLVLRLDVAALMGYTGAVFNRFFGTLIGTSIAATALAAWAGIPAWRALRAFDRKDF